MHTENIRVEVRDKDDPRGFRIVAVAVHFDARGAAMQLASKAMHNKSGIAKECNGAVMVEFIKVIE